MTGLKWDWRDWFANVEKESGALSSCHLNIQVCVFAKMRMVECDNMHSSANEKEIEWERLKIKSLILSYGNVCQWYYPFVSLFSLIWPNFIINPKKEMMFIDETFPAIQFSMFQNFQELEFGIMNEINLQNDEKENLERKCLLLFFCLFLSQWFDKRIRYGIDRF